MFLKLSNGDEARIMVSHVVFDEKKTPRRGTIVKMALPPEIPGETEAIYEARSVCNPSDNFSKKAGRRYAAEKLLQQCREDYFLAQLLTKKDRAAIFNCVCPQYAMTKKAVKNGQN